MTRSPGCPRNAETDATTIGGEDGEGASGWLVAAVIVLALVVDYAVFRFVLGIDYIHWYVANGAKLALVLTVLSLAVKLDDEPGLISAHPAQYVGAWLAFLGPGFMWLSNLARADSLTSGSVPFWDGLVAILFSLAWAVVAFAWMLVVVPAQYCVTLVCGAPARLTLSTSRDFNSRVEAERQAACEQALDTRRRQEAQCRWQRQGEAGDRNRRHRRSGAVRSRLRGLNRCSLNPTGARRRLACRWP